MFPNLTIIRIGIALVGALACLTGGFLAGQRWVQAEWDEQIAQEAQAELAAEQSAREKEHQDAVDQQAREDLKAQELRTVSARLADALERLRKRPDRMPDATTEACQGASGAQLSGPDAGFLEREAARANELRAALRECQGGDVE